MMKIYTKDNSWSTKRITYDWQEYNISEKNYKKLLAGDHEIDYKNSDNKINFTNTNKVLNKKNRDRIYKWTIKTYKILIKEMNMMSSEEFGEFTKLHIFYTYKNRLPSLDKLKSEFSIIYGFIKNNHKPHPNDTQEV